MPARMETDARRLENWIPAPSALEQTIADYTPISLKEIGKAALLNRVETKFVISAETLLTLLDSLHDEYAVLVIKGKRLNRYRTLYFDSADFVHYRRHHAGGTNRYKVRSRHYVETGKSFLELKYKDNKKRTHKQRYATDNFVHVIDPKRGDLLREHYPHNVDLLYGRLLTSYTRITLVHRYAAERVTIDLDLRFESDGRTAALPHIAIVEVKRSPHSGDSKAITHLRRLHVRPQRFSKYCIGVSLIYPHVKHNNFKPTLRLVSKLSQGATHVYQH